MFGGSKGQTTQQAVRAEKRRLDSSKRDVEREITGLRRTEQELIVQCKAEAKRGNTALARMKAKDVATVRAQIQKLTSVTGTLSSVSTQTTVAATNVSIAHAMGSASRALSTASGAVSVEDLQRSIYAIEQHKQAMEVTDEMLDDMFAQDEDEDEADSILAQVAEEIALVFGSRLSSTPAPSLPSQAVPSAAPATQESDAAIDAMIAKLLAS